MELIEVIAILVTLAAALSYVNHRFIRLPSTVGLMLGSLAASLTLMAGLWLFAPDWQPQPGRLVAGNIDFNKLLLEGMLAFLLFAGALHVNLNDLAANKWPVAVLAGVGVVGSTILVGLIVWLLSQLAGFGLEAIYCFLFAALISPTDPVAVLALLRKGQASPDLQTRITGESLFNDGIGVVVFLTLLGIAEGGDWTVGGVTWLLAKEIAGGAAVGLILGYAAYRLIRSIDHYQVEILATLALVTGGYALSLRLGVSGPIAMVVAGLLIGNQGRRLAMSARTREHLDMFWKLVDEILNAVLFVVIGLEVLVLTLSGRYLLAGAVAVAVVLGARYICVAVSIALLRGGHRFGPAAQRLLTWGALRGGISVALALALPPGEPRQAVLTMTYVVVAFSILVQGLTIGRMIRRSTLPASGGGA